MAGDIAHMNMDKIEKNVNKSKPRIKLICIKTIPHLMFPVWKLNWIISIGRKKKDFLLQKDLRPVTSVCTVDKKQILWAWNLKLNILISI